MKSGIINKPVGLGIQFPGFSISTNIKKYIEWDLDGQQA